LHRDRTYRTKIPQPAGTTAGRPVRGDPLIADRQEPPDSTAPDRQEDTEPVRERATVLRSAMIGAAATLAAAVVGGVFGLGPKFWTDFLELGPRTEPRTLTVRLPGDGLLPHSNIDVSVPDARIRPGESLWLAVQNLKDSTWYLHPCTINSAGEGACTDVSVGASVDAPGPWTVAAVVVGPGGHEKILEDKAKHRGDLFAWFEEDLMAIGSTTGQRR
jgi:hypothetical protein